MKVVGIPKGSYANFRAEPRLSGKILAKIPHNARNLVFSGACMGINGEVVPPSSDTIKAYWCRVLYRDKLGWIAKQYITEQ